MIKALYIHIPFCDNICLYCDFAKLVASDNLKTQYMNALINEIKYYKDDIKSVKTIYIGGGTPSSINLTLLEQLLNEINQLINLEQIIEYTIEANPNDINQAFVSLMKKYSINRISIGIQTTNDKLLKLLKRSHKNKDVIKSINLLRKNDIDNINLDFIYGIPSQTKTDILTDLAFIKKTKVPHISYYSLIIEDNTELKYLIDQSKITPLEEDLIADYSILIKNRLKKSGLSHYETSNYSKSGYESLHNLTYWNLFEYLGVGLSAASQYLNKRFKNTNRISKYIKNISNKQYVRIEEDFNPELEFLLMGLRKTEGIQLSDFKSRYKKDVFNKYPVLSKHIDNGLLVREEDILRFTELGQDLANQVYIDLL